MTVTHEYAETAPLRSDIETLPGPTVLEFGSPWCGYCRRAQPLINDAFADHAGVRHIKIADASRHRLGRSFGVKLWPTLVFLKDGREIARLVRPTAAGEIRKALRPACIQAVSVFCRSRPDQKAIGSLGEPILLISHALASES
jgi:thioredoxin 1